MTKPVQNISALRSEQAQIMLHCGGNIAAQYALQLRLPVARDGSMAV
jgi:hypothetical protein